MKRTTLFTAAILVAGGAITTSALHASASGSPGLFGVAASAAQEKAISSFEKLNAEFEAAKAAFKEKLGKADKKERKELRENQDPMKEYWPRFEALAQGGEGQALVWLADNLKSNREIKSRDRMAALQPIYAGLANHVNDDWFEDALKSFSRDGRTLGLETSQRLIETMLEKAKEDRVKAAVLFYGAGAIQKDAPEKAEAMMGRILAEFSGTRYGMMARASSAKPEDSEVGKTAPGFMAKSIDGFEFNLEDYRGKVTVLDFYGFW